MHPPPLQNQHESGAIRWTQTAFLLIFKVKHTKAMFTIPTIMVLQPPTPSYAWHLKLYIWNKPCF